MLLAGGIIFGLLLLPLILLLLLFIQPSRRRRFYTFRFGSMNGMSGSSRAPEGDVAASDDVIDVSAREISDPRRQLGDLDERKK